MLTEISIEIIRKCPNNCLYCSSVSSENCSEIIPFETFCEVISGAKKIGLQTVCFSGGEPFLHPDIVKMVDYVNGLGLNSYIYSSGIWMNEKKEHNAIPERIIKQLSGKVSKIIFNIEAAEEDTYDTIMGTKGNFRFLQESVKCAVKNGIVVEGHFVPMKINYNQIEKTLEFCNDLGFSKISFLRLVIHGRALNHVEQIMLSDEEMKYVKQLLFKLCKEKNNSIRVGVPLLGETQETCCEAANGKLNIKYDGKVFPCEVFKNSKLPILDGKTPESIFDNKIENIYENSDYLKTVRELVKQFSCGNNCENCFGQYLLKEKK